MSLHFYHHSLKQAEKLIREQRFDEARAILREHTDAILGLEPKERDAFQKLLGSVLAYLREINDAYDQCEIAPKFAVDKIADAIKKGNEIVISAKEVTKLCKDEELLLK